MYNQKMRKLGEERSAIRELFEYGNRRKAEIGADNVFDFSLGSPSVPAPARVGEEIARLMRETPPQILHGYTSAPGAIEARAAVADYIRTAFGVPMQSDLVYLTCGAAASLAAVFGALCGRGEEIIVPAPFFPEYRVFIEQAGGVLVPVPVRADLHLDVGAIGRAVTPATAAVLINSPNNPTGAVYRDEEIAALAALLREKSKGRDPILLIADEPYRELCYVAPPVYPMAAYEHTVVCYSFSKSLSLAGERIGYIAVSPQCAEAQGLFAAVAGAARALGYVCAPSLFQRAATACLGMSSDVGTYRENGALLYSALTEMGYRCAPPEGAFYLFVKALEQDAVRFSERARAHELLLVPSDSFGMEGYVRVSYCVPRAVIERSLPAFSALKKEYTGK